MHTKHPSAIVLLILVAPSADLDAAVVEYSNKALWQVAVNHNYHTIDFTGYPQDTIITTQYSNVGAVFTDGNDFIHLNPGYLNDGAGLAGNFFLDNHISINFSVPQHWMGMAFPGYQRIQLYSQGNLYYTSTLFGASGVGWFGGLLTEVPFDRAVIYRSDATAYLDDLYYEAVPAPGAMALFGLAAALHCRTRRRNASP